MWLDLLLWGLAVSLVSPLVLYAGSEVMPLAGLFAVAAGLALTLTLVGRQIHDLLLEDSLARRSATGKRVFAAGGFLLVLLVMILGLVVATLVLRRGENAR